MYRNITIFSICSIFILLTAFDYIKYPYLEKLHIKKEEEKGIYVGKGLFLNENEIVYKETVDTMFGYAKYFLFIYNIKDKTNKKIFYQANIRIEDFIVLDDKTIQLSVVDRNSEDKSSKSINLQPNGKIINKTNVLYTDLIHFAYQIQNRNNLVLAVDKPYIKIFRKYTSIQINYKDVIDIYEPGQPAVCLGRTDNEVILIYFDTQKKCRIVFYNYKTKKITKKITIPDDKSYFTALVSPDKKYLAVSHWNGIWLMDLESFEIIDVITTEDPMGMFDWSSDSKKLLIHIDDLYLLDIEAFMKQHKSPTQ